MGRFDKELERLQEATAPQPTILDVTDMFKDPKAAVKFWMKNHGRKVIYKNVQYTLDNKTTSVGIKNNTGVQSGYRFTMDMSNNHKLWVVFRADFKTGKMIYEYVEHSPWITSINGGSPVRIKGALD